MIAPKSPARQKEVAEGEEEEEIEEREAKQKPPRSEGQMRGTGENMDGDMGVLFSQERQRRLGVSPILSRQEWRELQKYERSWERVVL